MNKKKLREEAELYFMPFLLGSNRHSHALALKIFRKYGICSYILDSKRSFGDVINPTGSFWRLFGSDSELLCEQLIKLATAEPYTLPILIPTTPEYERFTDGQRQRLETVFVLCEPDKVFSDSPFTDIF